MALEIGTVVEGTVTNITNYGAFIELPGGKVGLVHISEIAEGYVADIRPLLKDRQQVKVRIIGINDKGKYDLSIKQVEKKAEDNSKKFEDKKKNKIKVKSRTLGELEREEHRKPEALSFEEKLARFMKESEERLLDIKRNVEAKRGKGRIR